MNHGHFINTCPRCGSVSQCRCMSSGAKQVTQVPCTTCDGKPIVASPKVSHLTRSLSVRDIAITLLQSNAVGTVPRIDFALLGQQLAWLLTDPATVRVPMHTLRSRAESLAWPIVQKFQNEVAETNIGNALWHVATVRFTFDTEASRILNGAADALVEAWENMITQFNKQYEEASAREAQKAKDE